jgi:PAS domain S-box-containing protein
MAANTDSVLDQAPDAILLCDQAGKIAYANSRATALFGYCVEELIGRPVDFLLPPDRRLDHQHLREAYAEHPVARPMGMGLDLVALRKDGTVFPVEISLGPVEIDGCTQVVAFIRDVTERRNLEAERERLHEQHKVLEERQRIAMDLHDGIMQSVFAIGLRLELIDSDLDPDSQLSRELDGVMDAAHGVVRDIRSYIFDLRPRDFSGQLDLALEHLVTEFKENARISTELAIEVPGIQNLDQAVAVALYQIVHEALSNARKYAQATSIGVRLTSPHPGELLLEVEDNGKGFEVSTDRDETHRGLRNMSARAQNLNGVLRVRSAPGAGTTVRLRVPVDAA